MEQFIVIGVMLLLMGVAASLDASRNKRKHLVTETQPKAYPEHQRTQKEFERADG